MKQLKTILLTLLISAITTGTFAHALWIETAGNGQAGKAQTVKVFYGEFVEGERDSVAKWYSDVKDFELWLVGPDSKKVKLETKVGLNFYEANFTPATDGTYTLAVSHKAKELGGKTLYHFLASTNVIVGKAVSGKISAVNPLQLHQTEIAKLNKAIKFEAYHNNAEAAQKKVSVFSPNGWSKELITDAKGNVVFTPPFAGRYVVEISDTDKTPGQHYGKPYEASWSGATYSFEVK
ncbi:MAG: DUF4198 domain-containing protein [Bacteroidota bacterium]